MTFATRRMSIRSEPMPMIMASSYLARLAGGAAAIHRGPHRANGFAETDKQRLPNHVVADVQLHDFRQCGDGLGGGVIEAVPGMHLEAGRAPQSCAGDDPLPFGFGLGRLTVDHGV